MIAKCGDSCSTNPPNLRADMSSEYLVTFGRAGHLGRFRAASGLAPNRGDRVVIHGVRGVEIGLVLGAASQSIQDPHVGQLLRIADHEDEIVAESREQLSQRICQDAEAIAERLGLSLAVLDAEVTLDGRGAVLHAVSAGHPIDMLLDNLAERHGLIVRHYDVGREAPAPIDASDALEEFKCDKPDCGEGHCTDCGDHGGCSDCSAGGAKELETYFASLRAKMEIRSRMPLA